MITTSERKLSLVSLDSTGISLEFVKYIKETQKVSTYSCFIHYLFS